MKKIDISTLADGQSQSVSPRMAVWISLVLVGLTCTAFVTILGHDFVTYDDNDYIYANPHFRDGLTWQSVQWALVASYAANWHPLTWLSHLLDLELYGVNPAGASAKSAAGHHMTSLTVHVANVLVLLLALTRLTGKIWLSAAVSLVFAIHPLQVETVAWVAQRKTLLSVFFGTLTLVAYANYVRSPRIIWYSMVVLGFALSLMAKQFLVTLPFVMLLLDFWPLGRLRLTRQRYDAPPAQSASGIRPMAARWVLLEKIPLLAMTVAACAATIWAQSTTGAVVALGSLSLSHRIANALVAYVQYLCKSLWPVHLAVFYPHYGTGLPLWQVGGSVVLLLVLMGISLWTLRRRPYAAVGWFWYLGTLVPVIGIVQVGAQSMADRYMYIPIIGLAIAVVWTVAEFAPHEGRQHSGFLWAITAIMLGLVFGASLQARHWRDELALFTHAARAIKNNGRAEVNVGLALHNRQRFEDAVKHYEEALRIKGVDPFPQFNASGYVQAHVNLGAILREDNRIEEAINHFYDALRISPNYALAHFNLGLASVSQNKQNDALRHFAKTVEVAPQYVDARCALASVLGEQGHFAEAAIHLNKALSTRPNHVKALYTLGKVLTAQGALDQAAIRFQQVLKTNPGHIKAKRELDWLNSQSDAPRVPASQ